MNNRQKILARLIVVTILATVVLWQWGSAAAIYGKALAAQYLIARSWEERRADPAVSSKPWPWADTWPVARLQWRGDEDRVDLLVLAGANAASLPFGPGHLQGSADVGEGTAVFAGHRDTHFRFLQKLAVGDLLRVQKVDGRWLWYRVSQIQVVDAQRDRLQPSPRDSLVLVTCYPFDAVIPGGPLRYLVQSHPVDAPPVETRTDARALPQISRS